MTEEVRGGIPFVKIAPVIDGQPGDKAWKQAICFNDFTTNSPKAISTKNNAKAWLCRDDLFLYFALLAEHDSPENARSNITGHDTPVWEDDDLEIFIDPTVGKSGFYHVLANTKGAVFDHFIDSMKHDNTSWDSGTKALGTRTKKDYYIELAIPFTSMNLTENSGSTLGLAIGRGISYCHDFKKVLGCFHDPETWTYFPSTVKYPIIVQDYSYSTFEGDRSFSFKLKNIKDQKLDLTGTFNGSPVKITLAPKSTETLTASTFLVAGKTLENKLILKTPSGHEVLRWYRVITPREILAAKPLSDLIYKGEMAEVAVTINEKPDSDVILTAKCDDGRVLKSIRLKPESRQFTVAVPFPVNSGTITCKYKNLQKSFSIKTITSPWRE